MRNCSKLASERLEEVKSFLSISNFVVDVIVGSNVFRIQFERRAAGKEVN